VCGWTAPVSERREVEKNMNNTKALGVVADRCRAPVALAVLAWALAGCGAGDGRSGAADASAAPLAGQVRPPAAVPQIGFHAASRFLEQAAWGPTPADVADVQARGFAAWIDAQLRLPVSRVVAPGFVIDYDPNNNGGRPFGFVAQAIQDRAIGSDDQLRQRVVHALASFLVISTRKVNAYGGVEYYNLLQDRAFGSYADLLKAVTLSPAMGQFLDNNTNTRWAPNENYARELMQLFSVGLVQLNLDGTPRRGPDGRPLETYTQEDVVGAQRALTGWDWADPGQPRPNTNFANFGKPMQASDPNRHDFDAKRVLGRVLGAGQTPEQDLDGLVRILVEHPNTAPFVSLRLIQQLTTSDPSPAYLQRVATVFRDSGGNLAQVVRAILLDPEARAGDVPGAGPRHFGRLRDPYGQHVALMRALGCLKAPMDTDGYYPVGPYTQWALSAPSVFNFYPPTHRVPGTLLLAPEQRMLDPSEFQRRFGSLHWQMQNKTQRFLDAGCNLPVFTAALQRSDGELMNLMSERMFRGAMPPAMRQGLLQAWSSNNWQRQQGPLVLFASYLEMASATPQYGVVR
jgi:uncharacterized protein (DUF1800 family)